MAKFYVILIKKVLKIVLRREDRYFDIIMNTY